MFAFFLFSLHFSVMTQIFEGFFPPPLGMYQILLHSKIITIEMNNLFGYHTCFRMSVLFMALSS